MHPDCKGTLAEEVVRMFIEDDALFNKYKELTANAYIQVSIRISKQWLMAHF
jgi:hypothetical protein